MSGGDAVGAPASCDKTEAYERRLPGVALAGLGPTDSRAEVVAYL